VDVTLCIFFFFSSRRRHTRLQGDWSSDVCSSDLAKPFDVEGVIGGSDQFVRKLPDGKDETVTLEFAELRTINVENFGGGGGGNGSGTHVGQGGLKQALDERPGAAPQTGTQKALRNLRPRI